MADTKEYLVHEQECGKILISEDVIASIAAAAVREVEGVYGLSATANFDISNIIGKKSLRRGIHVALKEEGIEITCNLVVKMSTTVMEVAQNVQNAIADEVASMTGERPAKVNVNVCGVAVPKAPAEK